MGDEVWSWSRIAAVEGGVAVAVDVAPERADAVEVAVPVGVEQVNAVTALDDERLRRRPIRLSGERVPEMGAVPIAEPGPFGGVARSPHLSHFGPPRTNRTVVPAPAASVREASPLTTASSIQPDEPSSAIKVPDGRSA